MRLGNIIALFGFLMVPAVSKADVYTQNVGSHTLTLDVNLQDGTTKITADAKLLGTVATGNEPILLGPYNLGREQVELLKIESGGTACPAQFYAVFFSHNTILSKPFGNCSNSNKVTSDNHSVTLSLPALDGSTDNYTIDANGVHQHHIEAALEGPAPTKQEDLAGQVLAAGDDDFFSLRAPATAMRTLLGADMFNDLKTCAVNNAPVNVPPYVVAESQSSPSCSYATVYFVFDHGHNVWIGTQAIPGGSTIWYGSPPPAVIQAANKFDDMQGQ